MSYTPPAGDAVALFFTPSYSPPAGNTVNLEFAGTLYLAPSGWDSSSFGSATVETTLTQRVRPSGFNAATFGTPGVGFAVRPAGWNSSSFGTPLVDYRVRRVSPYGFKATQWGAISLIWDQIIAPEGWDSFVCDYTLLEFDLRMRVLRQGGPKVSPSGWDNAAFGTPRVEFKVRSVYPQGWNSAFLGTPRARHQSIVALAGYGFDACEFGDVQRWEAGKVKPQGQDYSEFGLPRVHLHVHPAGFDALLFGVPVVGPVVRPDGFDVSEFGRPSLVHADGTEYTCGLLPRAFYPPGWDASVFGNATVTT